MQQCTWRSDHSDGVRPMPGKLRAAQELIAGSSAIAECYKMTGEDTMLAMEEPPAARQPVELL